MNMNITEWRVPHAVVGIVGGFFAAGLMMAILVPVMGPGRLRAWMVWAMVAVCMVAIWGGAKAVDRWVDRGRAARKTSSQK